MKQRKIEDCRRGLENKKISEYKDYLKSLSFERIPLLGTGELKFENGITVICGANGVGKSTLVKAIKNSCTPNSITNKNDLVNLKGSKLKANLLVNSESVIKEIEISNDLEIKHSNLEDEKNFYLFDPFEIKQSVDNFFSEKNIEEFIEAFDNYVYNKELEEISNIIGKKYTSCTVFDIDDAGTFSGPFLYFEVESNGVKYNNNRMGLGELAIFNFFHKTRELSNSIIVLEEPETFLHPESQLKLLDNLIVSSLTKNNWIIITSHSPVFLNNINVKNIVMLSHTFKENDLAIKIEQATHRIDYSLPLGITLEKKGIIVVEDKTALNFALNWIRHFSNSVLHEYDLVQGGSVSEILKILRIPTFKHFKIIGLFDGNTWMDEQLYKNDLNSDFTFLPVNDPEQDLKSYVYKNIKNVVPFLLNNSQNTDFVKQQLYLCQTDESHDWLENLAEGLNIDKDSLVTMLFSAWIEDTSNYELASENYLELKEIITKNNYQKEKENQNIRTNFNKKSFQGLMKSIENKNPPR